MRYTKDSMDEKEYFTVEFNDNWWKLISTATLMDWATTKANIDDADWNIDFTGRHPKLMFAHQADAVLFKLNFNV